jgi:hypothetical protein
MLFQWMSIHAGPHTWWNRINQRLWAFGVPWSPSLVYYAYLQEVVFENSSNDHETLSIWCHVGIHVDFYIYLAFTHSVGPSSVVWSELGPAPPFPANESAWSEWSQALSLVALIHWQHKIIGLGRKYFPMLVLHSNNNTCHIYNQLDGMGVSVGPQGNTPIVLNAFIST